MPVTTEWNSKKVIDHTKKFVKEARQDIAEQVIRDAKRILRSKAKRVTQTGLLAQFSTTETRDGKATLVWCQGPKKWWPKYHASFVELGTYKDEAKPFLRPAVEMNGGIAKQKLQRTMDKL